MDKNTDNFNALISIHAPREGGDYWEQTQRGDSGISIHAPREGGDPAASHQPTPTAAFQSTPPARGATTSVDRSSSRRVYFNPRPPRGGRPEQIAVIAKVAKISIHAPREGGDLVLRRGKPGVVISIHAPREGGDYNLQMQNLRL